MALSVAQFVLRFPEFGSLESEYLQSYLDQASRRTPADVWGDTEDDAHGWLTAHLIALSPFGRQANLVNQDGTTSYGKQRARMDSEKGPGAAPRTT